MRSPCLFLGSLAASLVLITPAEAQTGPPCCVSPGGEAHPDPERGPGPIFVPAEVRRRDERALEAAAEAPIPVEVPLVNAIGFPLEEPAETGEPLREPERARIVELPHLQADADAVPDGLISVPPCCQVEGETHPPDPDPAETPPVFVPAEVRSRDERTLEAAAEAPIPVEAPLVKAIGIPLEEQPGVTEPESVPVSANDRPPWLPTVKANAELIIALLAIMLAISLWLFRRRRPRLELEPTPHRPSPLPESLSRLVATPVPLFEPDAAPAAKATQARELETA